MFNTALSQQSQSSVVSDSVIAIFPVKMLCVSRLSLALLSLKLVLTIRVLQTNPDIELPPRFAQAEVLDSSLANLAEFTICLRLKTYQFTSYNQLTFSYQAVMTAGPVWILGAYIGLPCDQRYRGCTQKQKDRYGKDWKHSKVIGYSGDGVENHAFKTWQPGVWNSKEGGQRERKFSRNTEY